jgi:membrane protease YdiL (CAAX protease family)
VLVALGLVVAIVVTEYLARRFVLYWLPVLGALRVNDMLVAGLAYAGLIWLTIPPGRRDIAALPRVLGEILACARYWQVWVAALAAIVGTIALVVVDAALWGSVRLPSISSPWRWETVVLAAAAPVLVPVVLLLVNGVVIPFAEEWLWRGFVQPRLAGALGLVPGLLITAVLFSLKHAVIDASLGRLLALTAFGLVLGILAARHGWQASALAHALANIPATIAVLIAGAGQA